MADIHNNIDFFIPKMRDLMQSVCVNEVFFSQIYKSFFKTLIILSKESFEF